MNFLEFNKRFPTENAAIDFIVATKYKGGYMYVPIVAAFTRTSIIKNMTEENYTAATANLNFQHYLALFLKTHI